SEKECIIRDVETGRVIFRLPVENTRNGYTICAFVGDGTICVFQDKEHTLQVWNIVTGALVASLKRHEDTVFQLVPTFDGRYLISSGHDRCICVWDLTTLSLLHVIRAAGSP